jgi:hypothetical protein
MPQSRVLKCAGLETFPNELSSLKDGALHQADNVVIDREGVISPRRGMKAYGSVASGPDNARMKQLLTYKTRLLRHYGSTIDVDNGSGTFTSLGTGFLEPGYLAGAANEDAASLALRMRGIEANGNLYFTTNSGIKKLSVKTPLDLASATITPAGGVAALDGSVVLSTTLGGGGFFTQDSGIAYRMAWGTKDKNDNVILGSPSERLVLYNSMLSLLVADYNHLVSLLNTASSSGGTLSATDYLISSASSAASGSALWSKLQGLCTKLDTDIGSNDYSGAAQRIASVTTAVIDPTSGLSVATVYKQTANDYLSPGDTITIANNNALLSTGQINQDWTVVGTTSGLSATATYLVSSTGITVPSTAGMISGMSLAGSDFPPGTTISVLNPTDLVASNPSTGASGGGGALVVVGAGVRIAAPVTTAGGSCGTLYKANVPARKHATKPVDPATTTALTDLQNFFNDVVTQLIEEPSGNIGVQPGFLFATQSSNTTLTYSIPSSITSSNYLQYFYQIYRSPQAVSSGTAGSSTHYYDLPPSDELQLCYEANLTSTDITNGYFTFTDIAPDSFLGAYLYSNANSGEGASQTNEVPPLAADIAFFKGSAFYANTQTKHNYFLNLLTATGLNSNTLSITMTGATTVTNTFTFYNLSNVTTIVCAAGDKYVNTSATADYFTIYSATDATHYKIYFKVLLGTMTAPAASGTTVVGVDVRGGVPGDGFTTSIDTAAQVAGALATALNQLSDFSAVASGSTVTVTNVTPGTNTSPSLSMASAATTAGFAISATGISSPTNGVGVANYAASPAQAVDTTARNLVRAINKNTTGNVYAHYISGINDVPGALYLVTRTLGTSAFSLTVGNSAVSAKFNPTLPTSGTAESSTNDAAPNRVYYSKFQQPEAVPTLNYLDVGPKDAPIRRILPLRDALFVLTDSGVYRLSGDAGVFSVTLLDPSVIIKAPDTAATLNNNIYSLSNQGVVKIADNGVTVVSRDIEDQLIPLLSPDFANFSQISFATGYESDRAFLLATVTEESDTIPTQVFRLNTFTGGWTRWPLAMTCAAVNPSDDRLYIGSGKSLSILQERKSFSRLDYADEETTHTLAAGTQLSGSTLSLGSLAGIAVGDALVQTQYLTIAQFNRVLARLDAISRTSQDYLSTISAIPGCDLRTQLGLLAAKLDADSGASKTNGTTSFTYSGLVTGANTFAQQQTVFNAIVAKLNIDTGIRDTHFLASSGTTAWETSVVTTDIASRKIALANAMPFVSGVFTQFAAIPCVVTWAPQHFGDPSLTKHVREATFMYKTNSFSRATGAFASDLMPGFVDVPLLGDGTGTFGGFSFGLIPFGGEGSQRPSRTLIPRDKQRCRYLHVQWRHYVALEQWDVFGISLTYEATSSRGYR